MDVCEDPNALIVVPIVENELHEIDVGGRYGLEHVAADKGAAFGKTKFGGP